MNKLDECWLIYRLLGAGTPWVYITALPDEEHEFLLEKAKMMLEMETWEE